MRTERTEHGGFQKWGCGKAASRFSLYFPKELGHREDCHSVIRPSVCPSLLPFLPLVNTAGHPVISFYPLAKIHVSKPFLSPIPCHIPPKTSPSCPLDLGLGGSSLRCKQKKLLSRSICTPVHTHSHNLTPRPHPTEHTQTLLGVHRFRAEEN